MKPMLASSLSALPDGPGWAFEFKWDGVRALLDVSDGVVSIRSRNGNEISPAYPELVELATGVDDVLLDGEIVAFAGGRPSFERLQARMHVRSGAQARRLAVGTPVTFVVFDLLRRYGVGLASRPYVERRATLDRWIAERPGWTLSPFFDDGAATLAAAREHGLEGVLAKRLASPYRPGVRSPDWGKLRFVNSGEFVVVGWEGAAGQPDELSSLVLAQQRGGVFTFAGKVGSGLDARASTTIRRALDERASCPLDVPPQPSPGRVVSWCEPTVVVEVEYTMWTDDGRLRHPVFRTVRTDKDPQEATGDG